MNKYKILLLSDHPMSTSGVGVQSRWLITGLLQTNKYSFRCLGGAVKHENYDTVTISPDFIIKPTDGFGEPNMLRQILATERPDVLLLFTDPRFFLWVWEMQDEISQICPIAYNHLWDNYPIPTFNKVLYESTDLINCINYPTYEMVSSMFPEKTNYIPHALPRELYFPFTKDVAKMHKRRLLGKEREDHFVALWVGRNARRKMPSDIMISFSEFLKDLEKKHGHRNATLLMHTNPRDIEGPNLYQVTDMLGIVDNVVFSTESSSFEDMNVLYNISDVGLNMSCAEGFGLPTLETMQAGKPIITIMTGGLTRQVKDSETGEMYGIGLEPEVKTCVGTQICPYIYEDYVSHKTFKDAIMKIYELGEKEREELGMKARAHALKDYSIDNLITKWDSSLTSLIENWRAASHKKYRIVEL